MTDLMTPWPFSMESTAATLGACAVAYVVALIGNVNPVLLYVPNIIDYFRALFLALTLYLSMDLPGWCIFFYAFSQMLDGFDGLAARRLNQCSSVGMVFDMLVDRMSGALLMLVLSHLYKEYWLYFAGLLALDLVAHWFQTYVKLVQGQSSHKDGCSHPLLKFYYTYPYALLTFCTGNESWFMAMYLAHFPSMTVMVPNVLQCVVGGDDTINVWTLIIYLCTPIFCGKQLFNVIQLVESASDMAAMDLAKTVGAGKKKTTTKRKSAAKTPAKKSTKRSTKKKSTAKKSAKKTSSRRSSRKTD